METHNESNPDHGRTQAVEHLASANEILKTLQEKLGHHPEIGAAITKLEMALNILAVKTGAVL